MEEAELCFTETGQLHCCNCQLCSAIWKPRTISNSSDRKRRLTCPVGYQIATQPLLFSRHELRCQGYFKCFSFPYQVFQNIVRLVGHLPTCVTCQVVKTYYDSCTISIFYMHYMYNVDTHIIYIWSTRVKYWQYVHNWPLDLSVLYVFEVIL